MVFVYPPNINKEKTTQSLRYRLVKIKPVQFIKTPKSYIYYLRLQGPFREIDEETIPEYIKHLYRLKGGI